MKELVVVSGKGGTGKTSLVASFAVLAGRLVLADCDVDASNLHLLLEPEIRSRGEFRAGHVARIRREDCTECGLCLEYCRFDAVVLKEDGSHAVDEIACEGCGVCAHFCPEGAVDLRERVSGEWFVSDTRCGPMVHARLGVAAENSGKLVTLIRNKANRIATEEDLVIVDGSPGIGCPVIASVTGCDLALAVTEPTLSGLHDLGRIADLVRHFDLPMAVVVNKYDLNEAVTLEINRFCEERGCMMAGKIPYTGDFLEAMAVGQSLVEYSRGPASDAVASIWKRTRDLLKIA